MLTRDLRGIILLVMGSFISQAYTQPANLVLQDTTIASAATFTAVNSITAGPNFTLAGSGDVTFTTEGDIYFRPRIIIIGGGRFQAISETTLVDVPLTEHPGKPTEFALRQNYPNPFNPSTIIKYDLPKASEVLLSVYDLLGREVTVLVNEKREAGYHSVTFNASGLSTGVYFYRLRARLPQRDSRGGQVRLSPKDVDGHAGDFVQTRKFLLLR